MELCGFLSPNGQFIECPSYSHCDTAKTLCKNLYSVDLNGIEAEDFLYDMGYMGFYARNAAKRWHHSKTKEKLLLSDNQVRFIVNNLDLALNDEQLETIEEILQWNDDLKEDSALNSISKKYIEQ